MDATRLHESPIGNLVPIRGTDVRYGPYACFAFSPDELPQTVDLTMPAMRAMAEASSALARLDQACEQLLEPRLLIRPALYREALDTSALEGTHGQLTDILEAELPGFHVRSPETKEILGYLDAALHSFEAVKDRPITIGLLNEAQATMFREAANPPRDVGRVREHQVWIGPPGKSIDEARFVPLPGDDRLKSALEAWAAWVAEDHDWPPVLRAALAHYQFETLHPYGDGNGRIGRLVVVLQLLRSGAVQHPAITLSPWLFKNRDQYQDELLRVSCTGNWNPWVEFFCRAVVVQCSALVAGAARLRDWLAESRERVNQRKWAGAIYDVLDTLAQWPLVSIAAVANRHGITASSATNVVNHLVDIGVLEELSGRTYGRVFGARAVMGIVDAI